jgi:DNA-binding transcriptional LysR family regulator
MVVFIQVMESDNFTRAAEALGLPRSTVSTVIQNLEDWLGAQLLRRSTRRMVATEEGKQFLFTAREIVDAIADADQMFRPKSSKLRGRLRIDMPSRIGRRYVIPALPMLLNAHPELHIEVSITDRIVDLLSDGVDCLIRVGTLQNSDMICRKLGDLKIITCASPDYVARFGTPEKPEDLLDHKLVNYGSSLPAGKATFEYIDKRGLQKIPMASVIAVNNAESYIASACAGLGLIQIPAFDVHHLLNSKKLVRVLPAVNLPSMQLSLLYARRRNVPVRIAVFQDWVGDLLRRNGVFEV